MLIGVRAALRSRSLALCSLQPTAGCSMMQTSKQEHKTSAACFMKFQRKTRESGLTSYLSLMPPRFSSTTDNPRSNTFTWPRLHNPILAGFRSLVTKERRGGVVREKGGTIFCLASVYGRCFRLLFQDQVRLSKLQFSKNSDCCSLSLVAKFQFQSVAMVGTHNGHLFFDWCTTDGTTLRHG